jgi:hypothetical protein
VRSSSYNDCPKSFTLSILGFVLLQSLSYPKLCIDVLANAVSSESQYRGQKSCSSSPKRHVLIEPPRRPCTKTRSIRGSGAQNKDLKPSGPVVPSLSLACGRADLKLRVKKEAPLRTSPAGDSWCSNVGVCSVGDSTGASERDEGNTSASTYFER